MNRVCAALIAALGAFAASPASAGPTVCAAGTTTPGIDVSKWQGAIDWAKVAKTQKFVIARVSDGTYLDTWFDSYWPDIAAHGMVRGAYQFFEPAQDPIVQADILLTKMGPMGPGMLPPTLDVEATGGKTPAQVEAGVQQWIDHVQAKLGVAPIIYTGNWFWDPNVGSSAQANLPLWESYYCTNCCPKIPLPWKNWALWQYSDKGTVSGINGACDMDVWNGDLASLQAFAKSGGPVAACGDGQCDSGEDCGSCASDCGCAAGTTCQGGQCVGASVCGDGICGPDEYNATCCIDCPCAGTKQCVDGKCVAPGGAADAVSGSDTGSDDVGAPDLSSGPDGAGGTDADGSTDSGAGDVAELADAGNAELGGADTSGIGPVYQPSSAVSSGCGAGTAAGGSAWLAAVSGAMVVWWRRRYGQGPVTCSKV